MEFTVTKGGAIYTRTGCEGKPLTTRVQFLKSGAVRVTDKIGKSVPDKQNFFTVPQHAAVCAVEQTEVGYWLRGEKCDLFIENEFGNISFYDKNGALILGTPSFKAAKFEDAPVVLHKFPAGEKKTEGRAYTKRMGLRGRRYFVFGADEALYGTGSHEEGYGNLRGKSRVLFQHNYKACVPAVVSTKGYELVFAMGGFMTFHDDTEGSYLWCECQDEFDFYFLYGGDFEGTMKIYADLMGHAPMLPSSALGYVQCKERYKDAAELIAVASEYRERKIPLDVIVQDWFTWPAEQWGYKIFDETRYPDPKGFTDKLHSMDVSMMISVWPKMLGDNNGNRREMLEKNYLLGDKAMYDAFNPDARKLYWKQANEGIFQYGVDSWWCDDSEPFETDWYWELRPEPHERIAIMTSEARKYLDPTKMNAYSFVHSMGMYEGQRETTEKKRMLNLTRSSYIGQHRFGTVTWSGDVSAKWEVLRRHVPEGMNFTATGEPYWTTDNGAFFPGSGNLWFTDGDFKGGVNDLGYRELYTRWMQYSLFLPMMRSHGTDTPREVWQFGEEGTPFYDALKEAIELRYVLFPYAYSMMRKTTMDGISILRHPALVFPEDKVLRGIDDEMMFGESILVKPVTRPMYYGPESTPVEDDKKVSVYLPAGYRWYDWFTNEVYEGGTTATLTCPLDRFPMFVKEGSILPVAPVCQSTKAAAKAPVTLKVYAGKNASFTLYEDACDGYGYEKGEFAETKITWNEKRKKCTVGKRKGSFPGMTEKEITVEIIK